VELAAVETQLEALQLLVLQAAELVTQVDLAVQAIHLLLLLLKVILAVLLALTAAAAAAAAAVLAVLEALYLAVLAVLEAIQLLLGLQQQEQALVDILLAAVVEEQLVTLAVQAVQAAVVQVEVHLQQLLEQRILAAAGVQVEAQLTECLAVQELLL
jgi:hypothetical protein